MSSRSIACAALALALFGSASCVRATIAWTALAPEGAPAAPPVLGAFGDDPAPVESAEAWEARRAPALRDAFERTLYGRPPEGVGEARRSVRAEAAPVYGDGARFEEWEIEAEAVRAGGSTATASFMANVAIPPGPGPHPIIVIENFSPRHAAFPEMPVKRPDGEMSEPGEGGVPGVIKFVFGRYISAPPTADILARGYAVMALYPSEVAPDAKEAGVRAAVRLSGADPDAEDRWGAVGAWAWTFSRVVDLLDADPRFDPSGTVVFGHSRYGKAAIVAAAFDPRIDGVIAHQSGTGGASLNREKPGESVGQITDSYPHWFAPAYAEYAGREAAMPVDQHQLLALVAPRPLLLGNARRDVWSDPNGAFRAALGANAVYGLYGSAGMTAERLDDFRPSDDVAFWMRPGTHGVVEEDWPAFLDFLDAHFGAP